MEGGLGDGGGRSGRSHPRVGCGLWSVPLGLEVEEKEIRENKRKGETGTTVNQCPEFGQRRKGMEWSVKVGVHTRGTVCVNEGTSPYSQVSSTEIRDQWSISGG